MIVNGFGAVCTTVVMLVFAVTKFRDGAWVVLILIPADGVCLSRLSTGTTGAWRGVCRWMTSPSRRASPATG